MADKKKHWVLRQLEYLREEVKKIDFSSGTSRRRKDLIEILTAINSSGYDFGWRHCFRLVAADDGATAKIILNPTHWSNKNCGRIILEYPSFHNTHRSVFIFIEKEDALEIAKNLRKELCEKTFAFQYFLLHKQGKNLIPLIPS